MGREKKSALVLPATLPLSSLCCFDAKGFASTGFPSKEHGGTQIL